jgi:hypothetical protein
LQFHQVVDFLVLASKPKSGAQAQGTCERPAWVRRPGRLRPRRMLIRSMKKPRKPEPRG